MSSSGLTSGEEESLDMKMENGHEGEEGSTPTYCLFVGDLSMFCNEEDLQVAFSQFGKISEVRIKRNKATKRNLSYGFVEYTQPNAAVAAMNEMNGKLLNGRALKIRWANSLNTMKLPKAAGEAGKVEESRSISVYVAFNATMPDLIVNDEYLRTLFGAYGKIEDVSIKQSVIDRLTHCQRGYSFVCFEANELGMQAALRVAAEMKEVVLDGINYRCEVSRSLTTKLDPQVAALVAPAPKQPKSQQSSRGTPLTSQPSPAADDMMMNYGLTLQQQPLQYHQHAHHHHHQHHQQQVQTKSHYASRGGGNFAPPQQQHQPSPWMPAMTAPMNSPLSLSGYWPNGVAQSSFSPPPSPHNQHGGFDSFVPQIIPMYPGSLGPFAAIQGVFNDLRGNNLPTLGPMGGMNVNMGMQPLPQQTQAQNGYSLHYHSPAASVGNNEQRNFRDARYQQQQAPPQQPQLHRYTNDNGGNNGYGNNNIGRPPQQQRPIGGGNNGYY
jgi:hypothetical protein